jgi:Protein of unknown function (DUF3105)
MGNRREEKERLRQQRLAAERRETREGRRRLLLGYGAAGLLGAAVIVGIGVVIASGGEDGGEAEQVAESAENAHIDPTSGITVDPDERSGTEPPPVQQARLEQAAAQADCELRLDLRDEGNDHLAGNEDPPKYATNPPTSGDHDPNPLADGAYIEPPEPRNYVHTLEHGRIEIQYSPDLPEQEQLALKGVFDEDFEGMALFPNPDMPYEVAATAWTNLLGCDTSEGAATLDAIRAFRDTYRGQGPEPFPL